MTKPIKSKETPASKAVRPKPDTPVKTKTSKTVVTVPTRDQIAELAYHLFLARGGRHGQDLDDWFEAERRLLGGQS